MDLTLLFGLFLVVAGEELPVPPLCGVPFVQHPVFISAGVQNASQGGWPWAAEVGYKKEDGSFAWVAGAVIISPSYLLTSAVAVTSSHYKLTVVHVGDVDLRKGIKLEIESTFPHENSNERTNDIGLIRLQTPLKFNSNVAPVCLPILTEINKLESSNPVIAGWGTTADDGEFYEHQLEIQNTVTKFEKCKKIYSEARVQLSDGHLCAESIVEGREACQGFSGSGLVHKVEDTYYVIGLSSMGIKCRGKNHPSVYTRISHYLDWILKNIN